MNSRVAVGGAGGVDVGSGTGVQVSVYVGYVYGGGVVAGGWGVSVSVGVAPGASLTGTGIEMPRRTWASGCRRGPRATMPPGQHGQLRRTRALMPGQHKQQQCDHPATVSAIAKHATRRVAFSLIIETILRMSKPSS